ncbi:hypothetical protein [Thermophilibacter sp.]
MLDKFLHDDSTEMRLVRSIVQGALSVLIVTVPLMAANVTEDPTVASLITAAIMCVLSPVMSMLRTGNPEDGIVSADGDGDE